MDVDCPSLEAMLDGLRRAVQATAAEGGSNAAKEASGTPTAAELDLSASLSHLVTISRQESFVDKDLPEFLQGHGLGLLVDVLTREVRDMRYVRGVTIGRSGLEVARALGVMLGDTTAKENLASRRVWETKPDEATQLMTIIVDVLEKRYKEQEPTLLIMRILHALVRAAVGPKSLHACVKCFANDRRIRMLCRILSQYFPRPSTHGVAVRFAGTSNGPTSVLDGADMLLVWLELVHSLLLLGAWTPEVPPQHLLAVSYDATQSSRVHYVVEGIPPALLAPRRQARILYHRTRMAWKDSFAKYFCSAGVLLDGTPALEWALHVTTELEQDAAEAGDVRLQRLAAYLVDTLAEASHSLAMLARGREGFCQSLMLAHMERLAVMLARPVDSAGSCLGPIMPLLKFLCTETRPKLVSCYVLGDKAPPAPPKPTGSMFAAKSPQALDMELAAGAPVEMGPRWHALLESLLASVEALEGVGTAPPLEAFPEAAPAASPQEGDAPATPALGGGEGAMPSPVDEVAGPGSLDRQDSCASPSGPGRTGLSLDAGGCESLYRLIGFLHLCGMGTGMERRVWLCAEERLGRRLVWVMLRALTMMCPMAGGDAISKGEAEGAAAQAGLDGRVSGGVRFEGREGGEGDVGELVALRYQLAVDAAYLLSSAARADPSVRFAVTRFLGGNPADATVTMSVATPRGGAPSTPAGTTSGGGTPAMLTHTSSSGSLGATPGGSLLRVDSLGAHMPAKHAGGLIAKSPLIAFNAQLLKPYDEGAVSDTEGTPSAASLRGGATTPFSPTRTNMQPASTNSNTTDTNNTATSITTNNSMMASTSASAVSAQKSAPAPASTTAPTSTAGAVSSPTARKAAVVLDPHAGAATESIPGTNAAAVTTASPHPSPTAGTAQGRMGPETDASGSTRGGALGAMGPFPPIKTASTPKGASSGSTGSDSRGAPAVSMEASGGISVSTNAAASAVAGREGAPGNAAKGATPKASALSQGLMGPVAVSSPRGAQGADARGTNSPYCSSPGSPADSDGGTPHKSGHSKRNKMHKHPVATSSSSNSSNSSRPGGASVDNPKAGPQVAADGGKDGVGAVSTGSHLGPQPMSVSSSGVDGMDVAYGRSSDSVSSPMRLPEAAQAMSMVTAVAVAGAANGAPATGSKGMSPSPDRDMRPADDELALEAGQVELEMAEAL
eukprot:jgi/Mesvir1/2443/Mv22172-RA.1